jgi:RTX calcium-binding nonapeptide repeat (4 copies)
MSLLSGFSVTLPEVELLGEAARAAFAGGAIPPGWNVITPQQLGVPSQYWDGNYFTNNGASAIVLQQGSTWIVSFRGTDGSNDILQYPELVFGTYINHFQPVLNAVASHAPAGTSFYFTGASLGGGATNQMADIAGSQYGGRFASAHFVAFASPNISTANGILNVGFENDPIYKAVSGYNDFPSSLDNLVLATSQYMQGNYNGLLPPDDYAHNAALAFDAFARLQSSAFFNQMTADSVVIFDAFSGTVQDITPGRENTGVFYLGENVADVIIGRNGDDHIEGFAGDDALVGGPGNDSLDGGKGLDTAVYSGPRSQYTITQTSTGITVAGPDGIDTLTGVEQAQFSDATITLQQPGTVSATTVQNDYIGIVRTALPLDQATTVANAINSGAQTEFQYVNSLLSQVANTTIPAVAVEASMYGAVGTSAEVTALATQFLPAQVANATKYGFDPQVYATEALGLVFAFNNETGSTAFATAYGPSNATMPNSTAGDSAFAAAASNNIFGAASTSTLVNAINNYVSNWKAFYSHNGIPGISNPSTDQVDLAARGAAWGDAVGLALANNLGSLKAQATEFLMDAAQGNAMYSVSLVGQPHHSPFQGEILV